jgi:hypothetical protein
VRGKSSVLAQTGGLPNPSRKSLTPLESAVTYSRACSSKHATLNPYPATLTRYPHPKSNPCHSCEFMGGGGYIPRVHISLNIKHLAFSGSRLPAVAGRSPLSSKPLPAFTYKISFPQVLTRHHLRFSPQSKSLCAFTYENTGARGGNQVSIFQFRVSLPGLHSTPAPSCSRAPAANAANSPRAIAERICRISSR